MEGCYGLKILTVIKAKMKLMGIIYDKNHFECIFKLITHYHIE